MIATRFAGPSPFRFLLPIPPNFQDQVAGLRTYPWASAAEIAISLGLDLQRTRNTLGRLTERGLVAWRSGVTEQSRLKTQFRQYLVLEAAP